MKFYMISPEVGNEVSKLMRKAGIDSAKIDSVMVPFMLNNEVVELPTDNVKAADFMINSYRGRGWKMMTVPESKEEVGHLKKALKSRGKRIQH